MHGVTLAFLLLGAAGVLVLGASLLIGDLFHLGHPDVEGPFSVPAVAGFVGAMGFGGAIAAQLAGGHGPVAVAAGLATGLLAAFPTAWFAMRLSRAAAHMRTDATPTRSDLVGRLGVVVSAIPADGYGEVRVSLGGQPVQVHARAAQPLPAGDNVFVVEALTETSVFVERTPHV